MAPGDLVWAVIPFNPNNACPMADNMAGASLAVEHARYFVACFKLGFSGFHGVKSSEQSLVNLHLWKGCVCAQAML